MDWLCLVWDLGIQLCGICTKNLAQRHGLQACHSGAYRQPIFVRQLSVNVLETAGRILWVILGILTTDQLQLHSRSCNLLCHLTYLLSLFLLALLLATTL